MIYRVMISTGLLAFALAVPVPGQNNRRVPRAPGNHPDLQGVWTNATLTRLERPENEGTIRAEVRELCAGFPPYSGLAGA